jgi:3-ketosteroid 9alpha-monooxygenase subunit A
MLQLSMLPTGWFQIGWSADFESGTTHAIHYFGQELVAFRSDRGELSVLDAYCRHLGAHLGHDSKVNGDCVVCPYHGWEWDGQGLNRLVPYQDNPSRAKLRSWPITERHGLVFMWHDPNGGPPRGSFHVPNVFTDFEGLEANADDFFSCHPGATVLTPHEKIHPQLVLENSADCTHFRFTHGAPEYPQLRSFRTEGTRWWATMDFLSPKTKQPAMQLHNNNYTIGVTAAVFDSPKQHYRLVLTATPIDDMYSDIRVSYFFPRNGVTSETFPPDIAAFAARIGDLFEEDARIWRHQAFVQRPVYALADRAGYSELRSWSEQFYEAPEHQRAMTVIDSA